MNILGYAQRLGKSLMLPIATLPVAALLLRLGAPDLLDLNWMHNAGDAIFANLSLIFALGIAVGLAKDEHGAAALAGIVAWFVLENTAKTIGADIRMGVFSGIIAGIIAGHSYNRFHATKLPDFLAFFGGKRLVPIMAGLIALLIGFVLGYIWPVAQNGIDAFGNGVAGAGAWGQFSYGFLNRLLIPVGLHHVLNSIFWFTLGDCQQIVYSLAESSRNLCLAPEVVASLSVGDSLSQIPGATVTEITSSIRSGDLHRFAAGDPTAGVFMAGFYPVMMFGLPGAALAMYLAANKARRKEVAGILFSVAFTAFLTGVTEPLEFLFVFLSPGLYAIHAALTGLSMVVANALGTLHGFGFSAGLFDLVLNWQGATRPITLVLMGLVWFGLYFAIFSFAIRFFNLKTPGREIVLAPEMSSVSDGEADDASTFNDQQASHFQAAQPAGNSEEQLARAYLAALGGKDNLANIDACITRLRLTLVDPKLADEATLKSLGNKGIVKLGSTNLQIILGPQAEIIAGWMRKL